MLTPKRPAEVIASCVLTLFSTQTRTRGGWSDREANEATVMPKDFPSCAVVTIVTPLAKCDMASLKSASVTGMAAEFRTFVARREGPEELRLRAREATGLAMSDSLPVHVSAGALLTFPRLRRNSSHRR